ncbi:MAG: TIGR04283 family arsenosugar biosynthesis glycosyltransferase [Pseudomonadota bacterium]
MSAPVSVIVPTLNAADTIGPCLSALAEGAFDGLVAELILVDGGSSDSIAELAEGVGARLIKAPQGRGSQLSAGADAARSTWMLFIHADTVLPPGWPSVFRAHIERGASRAGYAGLAFDSTDRMARVTERWANLRSRLFALPYGDQGLLIHRDLYRAVGGYDAIPLMEDVALVRRLGRNRLTRLAVTATTAATRYERDGWTRRGARNLSTLALYYLGWRAETLAKRYRR